MPRSAIKLTGTDYRKIINIDNFAADTVICNNPTASPVLVRIGGNDYPTTLSFDYMFPAYSMSSLPVPNVRAYAVTFQDPASVVSTGLVGSAPPAVATITFEKDEKTPAIGSMPYAGATASPTQQDFLNGMYRYNVNMGNNQVLGPFDMLEWGGLKIFNNDDNSGGGQGGGISAVLEIHAWNTNDYASSIVIAKYPLWSNTGFILSLPKVARYYWINIIYDTLHGQGNWPIAGYISAYGFPEVIQEARIDYIVSRAGYFLTAPLAAGATMDFLFDTPNIPGLNLVVTFISVTQDTDKALVWVRTSHGFGTASIFYNLIGVPSSNASDGLQFSIPGVGIETRVTITNLGANPLTPNIAWSVSEGSDLTLPNKQIMSWRGTTAIAVANTAVNTGIALPYPCDIVYAAIWGSSATRQQRQIFLGTGAALSNDPAHLIYKNFDAGSFGGDKIANPLAVIRPKNTVKTLWVNSSVAETLHWEVGTA